MKKHVLAAFFNDARLNAMLCLNDLLKKQNKAPINDEEQLLTAWNKLSADKRPEQSEKLIEGLYKTFPFTPQLLESLAPRPSDRQQEQLARTNYSHEDYQAAFAWLFKRLSEARNAFVHPSETATMLSTEDASKLLRLLGAIYDDAYRTIKTRFAKDDAALNSLNRYKNVRGGGRKDNFVFDIANPDPQARTERPITETLSGTGWVLLSSLFLSKTQSAELVKYLLKSLQDKLRLDDVCQSLFYELIAVYRLRLPWTRLDAQDTQTTVVLDVISELARCPRDLFDTLSPEDQEKFRSELDTSALQDEQMQAGEVVDEQTQTVLRLRSHQDRFIPLMMRLLDFDPTWSSSSVNHNQRLCFAVDLGSYMHNVRIKPAQALTDGQTRLRRLGQSIITYGRAHAFTEDIKPESWLNLEKAYDPATHEEAMRDTPVGEERNLSPYLIRTYPHYHFYDDKIGMRIVNGAEAYPDLSQTERKGLNAQGQPRKSQNALKAQDMQPHFWLSPNDMTNMAFYHHLRQNNPPNDAPTVLELLQRYQSGMKKLFNALRDPQTHQDINSWSDLPFQDKQQHAQNWINQHFPKQTGRVQLNDLPDVMRQFLLGQAIAKPTTQTIEKRIELLLQRSQGRLNRVDAILRSQKKRGNSGFRILKNGQLATDLIEDLMLFLPKAQGQDQQGGGKPSGQYYQILQAALAYYGAHLNEPPRLEELFKETRLLDERRTNPTFSHPFLHKAFKPKQPPITLVDFYRAYYKEQINYLTEKKSNSAKINPATPPAWLNLPQTASLDSFLNEALKNHAQQPLIVPRGFFNDLIVAQLRQHWGEQADAIINEGHQSGHDRQQQAISRPPSISWLIHRYLTQQRDDMQAMYGYKRRYKAFDLPAAKERQAMQAQYLSLDERQAHTRKLQKQYRTQDENLRQQGQAAMRKAHLNADDTSQQKNHKGNKKGKQPAQGTTAAAPTDAENAWHYYKLLNESQRNERRLRQVGTQDILLFLYAKNALKNNVLHEIEPSEFKLSAMSVDFLEQQVPQSITLSITLPHSTERDASGSARSIILTHPSCKIKNLGELRHLARDRRLNTLTAYYAPADEHAESSLELHQAEIRAELNDYSRQRVKVMALVHELEGAIVRTIKHTQHVPQALTSDNVHFGRRDNRHGHLLYQMHLMLSRRGGDASPEDCRIAREIRNSFAHNDYPHPELQPDITRALRAQAAPSNPARQREVARRFKERLAEMVHRWKQELDALRKQ